MTTTMTRIWRARQVVVFSEFEHQVHVEIRKMKGPYLFIKYYVQSESKGIISWMCRASRHSMFVQQGIGNIVFASIVTRERS